MTRADFGRNAPLHPGVSGGQAAVPAVPDEYSTAPLFGDEMAARHPSPRPLTLERSPP
jgi:hypothetical protein